MKQEYFTILPMNDKGLNFIDKFGSERLKYKTLKEAI